MPSTKRQQKPQEATQSTLPFSVVCRALHRCQVVSIDDSALEAMFAGVVCKTLPEVAKLFGVEANTTATSWRPAGMPGEPGQWKLLPIVKWLLRRNQRNATTRSESRSASGRETELKLQILELDVQKREREEAEAAGELIKARDAERAMNAIIAASAIA